MDMYMYAILKIISLQIYNRFSLFDDIYDTQYIILNIQIDICIYKYRLKL